MFKYTVINENNKVVLKLEGDLDIEATEVIEDTITPHISNETSSVELDFEHIEFVDSSGIGLLITLVSSLKDRNRKPTIVNLKEDVKIVFDLLQLDEILGKDVLLG